MSDPQQRTPTGQNSNAGFWKTCAVKIRTPWPEESWKTFLLWILSIIIDPLVFYVPRINDQKKLLDFDRSFLLILSVLYFVVHICMLVIYCCGHKKSGPILWWIFIVGAPLVPVLTNGPLQLLLLFNSTKRIRASQFSFGMGAFLILYLLRVLGIYRLFAATALRKSAVVRILINLILYLYGGHLFGGLWYFFAVWKKMQCWNTACISHGACYYANHRFNVISGGNKFLDDICFNNTTEDTTYELGIFKDVLESRIVQRKKLAKKLLYCLRWGTQNLSGYGQNLAVSTRAWENIFVILIAIYGMTTYAFFIGNIQNLTKPYHKARWTKQDLEKWPLFEKLTKEQKESILKTCRACKWPQIGVVNVINLFSNLLKKDEDNIKHTLCSEFVGKIEQFQRSREASLVYNYIKPVVYAKGTRIINEGDPIIEMYFVLQGKLLTYSSRNSSNNVPQESNLLTKGDFWGEQLVSWAQNEPSFSNIPWSKKNIQALTEVEAFALMADDLEKVFKHNQRA